MIFNYSLPYILHPKAEEILPGAGPWNYWPEEVALLQDVYEMKRSVELVSIEVNKMRGVKKYNWGRK